MNKLGPCDALLLPFGGGGLNVQDVLDVCTATVNSEHETNLNGKDEPPSLAGVVHSRS